VDPLSLIGIGERLAPNFLSLGKLSALIMIRNRIRSWILSAAWRAEDAGLLRVQ
jgi:hypothetical protein